MDQALKAKLFLAAPLQLAWSTRESLLKLLKHPMTDATFRTVDSFVTSLEGEAREATAGATVETVDQVAEDLGGREAVSATLGVVLWIVKRFGLLEAIRSSAIGAMRIVAAEAHKALPHLPARARTHVRAIALLAGDTFASEPPAEFERVMMEAHRAASSAELLPPEVRRVFGLMEIIAVAGISGGAREDVVIEAADKLWRIAIADLDKETVEDAYWSADAYEVELRNEPSIPFDEVLHQLDS